MGKTCTSLAEMENAENKFAESVSGREHLENLIVGATCRRRA
jgi:hypothetical protein